MKDPVDIGEVVAEKYVVERVLGRGGVGVVVAAEHKTLGRRVAMKFLRTELVEVPEAVQRFLREGRAAAQLRSDHVARVLDADTTPGGAPYIVMELLEGRDLGAVLAEEGSLPVEVAVDYVLQACEAVAEAHAAGILHRDLKPTNLFLTRSPLGAPLVKVLDFGLSKIEDPRPEAGLTSDNHVMGSPHFMSPEQMRSSRDVDARSDVWALGVVLYALLAGRVPFRGAYLTEVCSAVLSGDAPRLSSLRAEVPPGLEHVVERCLRVEREERVASVAQLAAALAPFAGASGAARAAAVEALIASRRGAEIVVPPSGPASAPSAPQASPDARVSAGTPVAQPRLARRAVGGAALVALLVVGLAIALLRARSASSVAPSPPPPSPAVRAEAPPLPSESPVASDTSARAAPAISPPRGSAAARAAPVAPAAPRGRARPTRRPPSDEDVILELPH